MKYVIKQKIFSIGDSFTIKDEAGADAYVVRQQILSLGKKLRIFDTAENELCLIEQRLFKLLPEYDIFVSGELKANVKKKFAIFRSDFTITGKDADLVAEGDFLAFDFRIMRSGITIGTISKKFFALSDTYGVEIDDGEDTLLVLALVIVIDAVCHWDRGG